MKISEIETKKKNTRKYLVIDQQDRNRILSKFEPKFPEIIFHHITYNGPKDEIPEITNDFKIVGYTFIDGLEAFIVAVDGNINRPDGGIYHITFSLDRDKGFKPVHSNDVIKNTGFEKIPPIKIGISHVES